MQSLFVRFASGARAVTSDRRAVTAMEYGLIAALIAVVIIGGVTAVGSGVSKAFLSVSAVLPTN